mgnify:FL=1
MKHFTGTTIGDILRGTVSLHPDNEALVYPPTSLRQTFSDFLNSCIDVAKGFMAIGVKKDDHVAVWATNIPEWVHLQFGLAMIGAVLVTVNTSYKSRELEYLLRQSDSTTLILMEACRDTNFYEEARTVFPELEHSRPGRL